jgi:hypothetical protein
MNKINGTNSLSPLLKADNEINKAREAFEIGNHGKARVCARRAIGFIVEEYLKTHEYLLPLYGKSFMNNLRGIANDEQLPDKIRNAAQQLVVRPKFDEIPGDKAIQFAKIVMKYFGDKLNNN